MLHKVGCGGQAQALPILTSLLSIQQSQLIRSMACAAPPVIADRAEFQAAGRVCGKGSLHEGDKALDGLRSASGERVKGQPR